MRLLAPSRGTHTYWTDKDPVIFEGVIGLTKDRLFPGSLEYFIGDGAHKYSELPKYGAVKASTTKAADNAVKSDANGGLDGWKDAIIDAIIDDTGSGGLVTDDDGNLAVDFSQMPTDKFEELLKGLKMLIPLTSNHTFVRNGLFVDGDGVNASDTLDDGRGTQEKPFKTIQACVNFLATTYSIGSNNVVIKVDGGTYNESVVLPDYSRTTGLVYIRPLSYNAGETPVRDVIVKPTVNSNGYRKHAFEASGGDWILEYLHVERVEHEVTHSTGYVGACYYASTNKAHLYLRGCSLEQVFPDDWNADNSQTYTVRLIDADTGGTITLLHGVIPHEIKAVTHGDSKPSVDVVSIGRGGTIVSSRYNDTEYGTTNIINCSGSCSRFLRMFDNSRMHGLGAGTNIKFVDESETMTGKQYELTTGSTCNYPYAFPGDTSGTVESATGCWFTGENIE